MTSLRVALCQMRVHPGEPARNAETMLRMIAEYQEKADLLVFPELCVPGYFLGDGWERPAFLRDCETWNARIIESTAEKLQEESGCGTLPTCVNSLSPVRASKHDSAPPAVRATRRAPS